MSTVKHGKRKYKQMALEVAVRNPERYEDFLRLFSRFEGCVLNDKNILDIMFNVYAENIVVTNKIDTTSCSEKELKDFIRKNISHNNEWGYPTGYQAGFTRFLKTLSEFGFIYAQYNEPLRLSEVAKSVVSGKITLSEAFALQSMRFWRKSPYRRVLNDFNFFAFVLQVLQMLEMKGKKLSYPQFMLSLFSDDGNVENFVKLLSQEKVGNNMDKAYTLAKSMYHKIDANHAEVCKQQSSFNDYGNTVFRVLQLTGFITVEFNGIMMLSINKQREHLLNTLLSNHFTITESAKENEDLYFNEIGSLPEWLLNLLLRERTKEMPEANEKLETIISSYNLTESYLADYIKEVSQNKNDKRMFWFIQAPLKFEFLLALYLYSCLGDDYEYKPNYLSDDAGIPYSHAPGNIGDIEIFNSDRYWLIEATLIKSKNQQINSETINLFRHIDFGKANTKYLSLVAPNIHQDTALMLKVAGLITMFEKNHLIFTKPYSTDEFIDIMKKRNCLEDMQQETKLFSQKLKTLLKGMA